MPYIRKIEIRGFKTFAAKTTMTLDKGFTVITGPNGSGKTNIIDAVLFCLGELSARRLRAESFSDLIFHGSSSSGGRRSARVLIQFDNSDGRIPVETSRVTISREINRKGQSVYRLNGRRISRSRVMDILSIAGISPYGHNIVLQGTITRMAEISSNERRRMIEDMIGIAQYDAEKAEAESKLKMAEISIQTAMGQVGEVQKRIEDLERERNDLLRYNFIQNEIRRLEALRISHEMRQLQERIERLSSRMRELEGRVERLRRIREDLSSRRREVEEEWRRLGSERLEEGQSRLLRIQMEMGDLRSRLTELKTQINSGKSNIEALRRMRENAVHRMESLRRRIEESNREIEGLRVERDRLRRELGDREGEYERISRELSDYGENVEKVNERIREIETELNTLQQESITLRSDEAESRSLITMYSQRLNDLNSRREDVEASLERLKESLNDLRKVKEEQMNRLKSLQRILKRRLRQRKAIEREVKEAEKIAETASKAVIEFTAQRDVVKKIKTEEETLRNIEELGELGVIPGIYGRLRKLIKIEKGYEHVVEAAAAGWLDSIVVRDLEAAFTCSETLRRLKLGRIKIIPLDGLTQTGSITPPDIDGIKGVVSDLVRYPREFQPAISFIFGDTLLALSGEAALKASRKGYRVVTVDGDLYEAGGGVESGIHRAPIDFSTIVPSESAIKTLDRAVRALRDHLRRREEEAEEIEREIHDSRVEITRLTEAMNRVETEITRVNKAIGRTRSNLRRIDENIKKTRRLLREEEKKLKSYGRKREESSKRELKLREELEELRRKTDPSELRRLEVYRDKLGGELLNLRQKLGSVENELKTLQSERDNILNVALKNTETQISRIDKQISDLELEVKRSIDEEKRVKEEIAKLEGAKEELSKTLLSARKEAERFTSQLEAIESKLNRVDREYEEASDLLGRVRLNLETLKLRMEQCRERLESYGYSEPLKVSEAELREAESSLRMMKMELEGIGAVNQLALSHYAEQVARYKELSIRMNELEREKMAILKFIDEIERRKYKAFMEAFNQINENLGRYFSRLTGGGEAYLKLENPEKPFSGGVDMVVKFPGKPSILISGASSGERSVAAVAFLFALQGLTPASFYLFDEIDAHLDAFHVERLGELLAEEASNSQFIVITLKPEMVGKADKVYGVYGRNGVSHIISTTVKGAS